MNDRALRVLAVFPAALFVLSVAVMPMASAAATDELNYGSDAADPIWIDGDVTVAKHDMSEGATHDDMARYYDDNGDWVSDPVWEVNESIGENVDDDEEGNRNRYTFKPGHVEDRDFDEFPRKGDDETNDDEENLASALPLFGCRDGPLQGPMQAPVEGVFPLHAPASSIAGARMNDKCICIFLCNQL